MTPLRIMVPAMLGGVIIGMVFLYLDLPLLPYFAALVSVGATELWWRANRPQAMDRETWLTRRWYRGKAR